MKQRFENRRNEFICKWCGDAMAVSLAEEMVVKRQRRKRKYYCSKECARKHREAKHGANKVHS